MNDLFSHPIQQNKTLTRRDLEALVGFAQTLVDCDLDEVDLSGLDLTGWKFERCNLRRCDLQRAMLEGTAWFSCRGAFASFATSDLTDGCFVSCDFNNVSFKGATLQEGRFSQCKLTGADLSDVRAFDIAFDETLLINAKLPGQSFHKAVLNRVDFSQADLRKCDFRQATLDGCSLREANVAGSRFAGADLRGADLGGLRLIDANLFRGATISREQAGQLLGELGLNVR